MVWVSETNFWRSLYPQKMDIVEAARVGSLEKVRDALKAGVHIDRTDQIGCTALMAASLAGHEVVVEALLKGGATVDMQAKDGFMELIWVSAPGHEVVVEALLKAKQTIDMQTEGGVTALMAASFGGHEVVVEALLKGGATVDMQGVSGSTALMAASVFGHEVVVEALLKGGGTVDMQDKNGFTALMEASTFGHEVVVEALLKGGATVDMQAKGGSTALMVASAFGHEVVVEALLKGGATVDMQDKNGLTALMAASDFGHEVVVEALLKGGATVDMQEEDGETALSLAESWSHLGVVELLHKASIQPKNTERQKVESDDGPHAAAGMVRLEGEKTCPLGLKVEPDERFSAHKSQSGHMHSKHELAIEQVQSPSAFSKEEKTVDENTISVLQRRCNTLEQQLKQEQHDKQCIQEHSEELVQDMTTTQLQLQQQLSQEKREAIQTKQQLQQQASEIQKLQQRLTSATTDSQQLQQRLTIATTDNQQLQQRLISATTDNQQLQQRLTSATTDNQQLQQRLGSASAELQSLQDIEPWKISRNKVEIQAEIGVGGWGSVSKGTVQVAVKKLHGLLLSQHNVDRVQREMRMLAQVRHPNLVQFVGVVFDEAALRLQASPMIITELLEMNLRTAYERELEFNKLSIFQDVARALNYLHKRHDPIIHRDISAPNVLLEALPNRTWKGKVSDLGSANLAKLARTLAEGAIIYAAPETMPHQAHNPRAPKLPQTTKVDVYSYGVLLCEVGTSRFPDPDHYPDMLEQVQHEWPSLHDLIMSCTRFNPDERPTIAEVQARLSHPSH